LEFGHIFRHKLNSVIHWSWGVLDIFSLSISGMLDQLAIGEMQYEDFNNENAYMRAALFCREQSSAYISGHAW